MIIYKDSSKKEFVVAEHIVHAEMFDIDPKYSDDEYVYLLNFITGNKSFSWAYETQEERDTKYSELVDYLTSR